MPELHLPPGVRTRLTEDRLAAFRLLARPPGLRRAMAAPLLAHAERLHDEAFERTGLGQTYGWHLHDMAERLEREAARL